MNKLLYRRNFKKVQNFFKEYFGEIVKAVNLELKVIKPQDAENVGFRNVAEEHGELAKKKEEISKDDLLNSPYVKQAKDLFKVEDNKIMVQLNKKSPR